MADLQREFGARRDELLGRRRERRAEIARTDRLDFLPETEDVREGAWQVAPAPADLVDRRVEITGPTEPKMAINALNSGAKVWLADLEDANTPHWANVDRRAGQRCTTPSARTAGLHVRPRARSTRCATTATLAVIVVRPRGWHLDEKHLLRRRPPGRRRARRLRAALLPQRRRAARAAAAARTSTCRRWRATSRRGSGTTSSPTPRSALGIPHGTIRATVLIETIPAAFEMDEILYELRDHASGLNAGRWDYLFSIIKNFRDAGADFVLPDRSAVTMTAPFMRAYTELLVATCHRRGAFAIGGMAAFIPSRRDAEVNERALAKVREDKEREAGDGFDGSWVAHPDLVPVCRGGLRRASSATGPTSSTASATTSTSPPADLLDVAATAGARHRGGPARQRRRSALRYLEAWLRGNGAVGASTTSWRTRRPPRSPARRSGSGCTTASAWTTATRDHRRPGRARIADEELGGIRGRARRRGLRDRTLRRGARAVRAGRARRRLRRLPDPAGVRDGR